jgi:hypothetical protein
MEADWEVEVGGGAPVIEADWPGFVDLRLYPERASQLQEALDFPPLAEALVALNAATSPVWTSKCDVWPVVGMDAPEVDPGSPPPALAPLDPDELDAPSEQASYAIGCYIDLLPRSDEQWLDAAMAAAASKRACSLLHAIPLRCCRVDLITREALIVPGRMDLGITAYVTACGASSAGATETLHAALAAFARVLSAQSTVE